MVTTFPGVYVDEPAGPPPIPPVDVATAALIGEAQDGPFTPQRIGSVAAFQALYRGSLAHPLGPHDLSPAVHGFFANGRDSVVVLRMATPMSQQALISALRHLSGAEGDAISLLHAPGAGAALVGVVAEHAEAHAQLVVADAPRDIEASFDPAQTQPPYPASSRIALYAPWFAIHTGAGGERVVPPGGHVLGAMVRSTRDRGVHKAPANVELRGVARLDRLFSDLEQAALNPRGVDLIRDFAGRGTLIWGARTLQRDGELKFIAVRRTLDFLQRSLQRGTQWVVFEPNGEPLWQRLRASVHAFLLTQWRDGVLLGDKPEHAFYVRCDRSTMTADDIDHGRLICEIAVALVRPAEFLLLRVTHPTRVG